MRDLGWADEADDFLSGQADAMADKVDTLMRETHLTYNIREVFTADMVERAAVHTDQLAKAMHQLADAAGTTREAVEEVMSKLVPQQGVDYATIGERARRERKEAEARAIAYADTPQIKVVPNRQSRRAEQQAAAARARRERRAARR